MHSDTNATISYPYEVLKPSIVLQQLFVEADGFSVVAAEISITVFHPLSYFPWELESKQDQSPKQRHNNMLCMSHLWYPINQQLN